MLWANKSTRKDKKEQRDVLVLGVTVVSGLVKTGRENLDVTSTAVDLLLVFDRERDHEIRALAREFLEELGGDGVETSILRSLESLK